MPSLNYDVIYSRLFVEAKAYNLAELSENVAYETLSIWLHSAACEPYVYRLFSELELDDIIMQLNYKMNYSINEKIDQNFVVDVLSLGMILRWLEPQINDITNLSQMFGSKDEKFYSQSAHLAELRALYNQIEDKQKRKIADRGTIWNSYLDGDL